MSQSRSMKKGPLPMRLVLKKTKSAIAKAQQDYEDWSGGYWLWKASEYMLTMYIAREIANIDGHSYYLTVENNVREALQDAGGLTRGRLRDALRPKGKMDILLWWGSGYPRAVIEVKNQVGGFGQLKPDIDRICNILRKKKTTFQCGVMAFYSSCRDAEGKPSKRRISSRLKNLESTGREFVRSKGMKLETHATKPKVDGDSAWVAAAWKITRA